MVGKGLRFYSEGFNRRESEEGERRWYDMEDTEMESVPKDRNGEEASEVLSDLLKNHFNQLRVQPL